MTERNFMDMLQAKFEAGKMVCVGLDSDITKLPNHTFSEDPEVSIGGQDSGYPLSAQFEFNVDIIDATADLVCAYKPNTAFYEANGWQGIQALEATIRYIRENYPDVPVILDAKRADIGNTNAGYAQFAFDILGADAITVHPYLGQEALQPFLDRRDKGIIVLCRTSNPGAGEFQDLESGTMQKPLWLSVAGAVADRWNANGNCAVVVGATYPKELGLVRGRVGDMPILVPGIGAQGGDLARTVEFGRDSCLAGLIINNSRGIIFASDGADFAEAARTVTINMHNAIAATKGANR